jgi:hypothetical protein
MEHCHIGEDAKACTDKLIETAYQRIRAQEIREGPSRERELSARQCPANIRMLMRMVISILCTILESDALPDSETASISKKVSVT